MRSGPSKFTKLSPRETEVLAFVMLCINVIGRAPTHREISDRIGIRSREFAARLLRNLETKGAIRIQPYKVRGIELVKVAA